MILPRLIQSASYVTLAISLLMGAHEVRAELGPVVSKTKVGAPSWEPVDFHLFSGPLEVNDFADIGPFLNSLLPGPNHAPHPDLGVGPGAAHAPPYDTELGDGIVNAGVQEKTIFDTSEFSSGQAVYWAWMNIPSANPVMGSSPDFSNGPIIPNTDFPVSTQFFTEQNGEPFEVDAGLGMVPPLDNNLDPPFDVDGHSHYPQFFIDGFLFSDVDPSRGPNGLFEYRASLRDSSGNNGWDLAARFQVIPEPTSFALVTVGILGVVCTKRRRQACRDKQQDKNVS